MKKSTFRELHKEEEKEEYIEFKPVLWEGLKPPEADNPDNEKKKSKKEEKKSGRKFSI